METRRSRAPQDQAISIIAAFQEVAALERVFARGGETLILHDPSYSLFQDPALRTITMLRHTELLPKGRSLPHPYPIALSPITSNYGFYCYRADGGFCFHNFHAAYAAKDFIDRIIDDQDYKWLRDDTILLDNGTRIRGERSTDLETIIEYEPTKAESGWEASEPDVSYINCFLGKSHIAVTRDNNGNLQKIQYDPRTEPRPAPTSTPRRQITEEERTARKKAKTKTGQYVTISDICKDLGHEPRVCRAMLRKLKLEKPAHGWAWPPSEAETIRNKLKKLL